MSVFSTNQVRQMYVLADAQDTVAACTDPGDFYIQDDFVKDGKPAIYIVYRGADGLLASDIIENVTYVSAVKDEKIFFKQATLTAASATMAAGDSVVIGFIYNVTDNVENTQAIYGSAVWDTNMTTTLKAALTVIKNSAEKIGLPFSFDITNMKVAQTEGTGWRRGIDNADPVDFKIEFSPVYDTTSQTEVLPATIAYGKTASGVNNGKKIADMEYFYMGERGDIYRGKGWPVIPETQYLVDPTAQYATLDVHFAYQGPCEDIQKSEKDILFVAKTADKAELTALKEAIEATLSTNAGTVSAAIAKLKEDNSLT